MDNPHTQGNLRSCIGGFQLWADIQMLQEGDLPVCRIMIIGGPGAGKTWLAHRLGQIMALPVHSVDDFVRDQQGNTRPADQIDASIIRLAQNEKWIIEGGNTRSYSQRAQRADLVIHLVPPIWLRAIRVIRRDSFRLELLWWTFKYDATFGSRDQAATKGARADAEVLRISRKRELDALLERVTQTQHL